MTKDKIKSNKIISIIRLFFGFCPNCNSDAPKKDTCKICNNGQFKKRKELNARFKDYEYIYLSDEEKQKIVDCIDWIYRINGLKN